MPKAIPLFPDAFSFGPLQLGEHASSHHEEDAGRLRQEAGAAVVGKGLGLAWAIVSRL